MSLPVPKKPKRPFGDRFLPAIAHNKKAAQFDAALEAIDGLEDRAAALLKYTQLRESFSVTIKKATNNRVNLTLLATAGLGVASISMITFALPVVFYVCAGAAVGTGTIGIGTDAVLTQREVKMLATLQARIAETSAALTFDALRQSPHREVLLEKLPGLKERFAENALKKAIEKQEAPKLTVLRKPQPPTA